MRRKLFALSLMLSQVAGAMPPRIRHQQLPPLPGTPHAPQLLASDNPAELAAAILTGHVAIARPSVASPGDDTPVYAPRSLPRVALDRRTGADGKLHYASVFDPEVVPFKRELAFDVVLPDVTLAQSHAGDVGLPPQPLPTLPDRELFWGHLRLKASAGQIVPLPSIAPDSRVLQWQTVPQTPLQLRRDRAGNFTAQAGVALDVDLRFVMDAPSSYFAAPLGSHRAHNDPQTPTLPAQLQAVAASLWPLLHVAPGDDRAAQLLQLAAWFRGFQPGEPPAVGSHPLADLVAGRKGVCRHRALGFVVMAHSLGIPAHYVMNDAHAFVEIWAPLADGTDAWQRLDLGGGAESLEVHAAAHKHLHVPELPDPFPRPPGFGDEATDVRVDGQALGHALAGARQLSGLADMSGVTTGPVAPDPAAGTPPLPQSGPSPEAAQRAWLRQRAASFAAPLEPPRLGAVAPARRTDPRLPTQTLLRRSLPMAWVGEALPVAGQLVGPAGKVDRLQVELWLIDPRRPLAGRLVGVAVTASDGHFAAQVAMPLDAELGSQDLVARFAGTAALAPSDSSQP